MKDGMIWRVLFAAAVMSCAVFVRAAMPTEDEVAKARLVVQDIVAGDVQALKAGKLAAAEAVGKFLEYAEQVGDDNASRWIFRKLAFDTAVDGGVWDDALKLFDDLSADYEAPKITKNAYKNLSKTAKKDESARALLARIEIVRVARKNRKDVEAQLQKKPGDPALTEALAIECALLGDWKAAESLFAKGGGKAAQAIAAEKTPADAEDRARKAGEAARLWWEMSDAYAKRRQEALELLRVRAGVLYAEALAGGVFEGLVRLAVEKRVAEAAEYAAVGGVAKSGSFASAGAVAPVRSAQEVRRRPGKIVETRPNTSVADDSSVRQFKDRKGVTWAYSIQNGEAVLRSAFQNDNVAQGDLSGEVKIPVTLGNCPVLAIPKDAFKRCDTMTRVVLPPGLKSIGVHAFEHTKSLEEIVIPESVTEIGSGAFAGSGIRKIQLPANIVKCCVGSTFANCPRLESIDLPDGIEDISVFSFIGCKSLRKVRFPKSLKSMHDWTFHDCDLEEVVLPAGVERIGHHAFSNNRRLKFLRIESENLHAEQNGDIGVIRDLPAGVPVYVTKRWKGPLGMMCGHMIQRVK